MEKWIIIPVFIVSIIILQGISAIADIFFDQIFEQALDLDFSKVPKWKMLVYRLGYQISGGLIAYFIYITFLQFKK